MGVKTAKFSRIAPDSFSAHVSIATLSCNSGLNGISSSRRSWNVAQSMLLKSSVRQLEKGKTTRVGNYRQVVQKKAGCLNTEFIYGKVWAVTSYQ